MDTTSPILLRRPEDVRIVTSPIASQIVSIMERTRRNTVGELAELVGIEAGSLYYHVRKLNKIGVLLEHDKLSTGGRQEVVYELAGTEIVIDPDERSPAFLAEIARGIRSRLRKIERGFVAALGRPGTIRRTPGRNLSLHHHQVRLKKRDRAEFFRRVEELEAFLVEHDDKAQQEFLSVTLVVLPEARKASG